MNGSANLLCLPELIRYTDRSSSSWASLASHGHGESATLRDVRTMRPQGPQTSDVAGPKNRQHWLE